MNGGDGHIPLDQKMPDKSDEVARRNSRCENIPRLGRKTEATHPERRGDPDIMTRPRPRARVMPEIIRPKLVIISKSELHVPLRYSQRFMNFENDILPF